MKNTFLFLFFNSLLIVSCNGADTYVQNMDNDGLTTADAILDHLKTKNQNLDEDDICIDEIDGFSEFFIVGSFAHDRGCDKPSYYFEGDEVELSNEVIQKILINGNFEEDNLAAVEAYHIGVTNHYDYSLATKPDDFDETQEVFTAPNTSLLKGMIISKIWVQERSGMLPEVRFHLSALIFELDGTMVEHKTSNHFTVQYK